MGQRQVQGTPSRSAWAELTGPGPTQHVCEAALRAESAVQGCSQKAAASAWVRHGTHPFAQRMSSPAGHTTFPRRLQPSPTRCQVRGIGAGSAQEIRRKRGRKFFSVDMIMTQDQRRNCTGPCRAQGEAGGGRVEPPPVWSLGLWLLGLTPSGARVWDICPIAFPRAINGSETRRRRQGSGNRPT